MAGVEGIAGVVGTGAGACVATVVTTAAGVAAGVATVVTGGVVIMVVTGAGCDEVEVQPARTTAARMTRQRAPFRSGEIR
jgi:hypothetical protein